MKLIPVLCLIVLPISFLQSEPKQKIPLGEFAANYEIIGVLGLPLGRPVAIKAVVISGRDLGNKMSVFKYYLKMRSVGGVPQKEPLIMSFSLCPGCVVDLPGDGFELYRYKNPGKETGSLTGEQIKELEKGYVGKELSLMVYETGGYHGIPALNYREYALWQDVGFYFRTKLIILKEAKDSK